MDRPYGRRVQSNVPAKRIVEQAPLDRPDSHEDETIAKRRQESLDMKIAGASYRQIAKQTGVSLAQAYEDVQAELQFLSSFRKDRLEEERELSARKLDRWTLALTPKMKTADVRAIRELTKIEERRAKLLGLDAPTKIAQTLPDGTPVSTSSTINIAILSEDTILRILADTAHLDDVADDTPSPTPGPSDADDDLPMIDVESMTE